MTDALDELDQSSLFEDVNYADGVLNIEMKDGRAYVINKQAPNMQIWLSSPLSGPQRFEYELDSEQWLQIRSKEELVTLLEKEFNESFRQADQPEIDLKV